MLQFAIGIFLSLMISVPISAAQYRPLKNDAEKNTRTKKLVFGKIAELTPEKIIIENENGAQKTIELNHKTQFRTAKNKGLKATEMKPGLMVRVLFRVSDGKALLVQEGIPKQF